MASHKPGCNLSRECIRDTLLSKRDNSYQQSGLALALYNMNIRVLRNTQLKPHVETMYAERYRQAMLLKRTAPDIIVVIRNGVVQEVRSTNPFTNVMIANYDCNAGDDQDMLEEAEGRAAQHDMHIVY